MPLSDKPATVFVAAYRRQQNAMGNHHSSGICLSTNNNAWASLWELASIVTKLVIVLLLDEPLASREVIVIISAVVMWAGGRKRFGASYLPNSRRKAHEL